MADLPGGYRVADALGDLVQPGKPGEGRPDVCADPVAVGSVVDRPAVSSRATFFRQRDGLVVYEILVAAGAGRAGKLVAEVGRAPVRCPVVRVGDDLTLSLSRMSVPDLGARASGVLIRTETEPSVRARLIVFAAGDVTAIVMAVGATDVGLRGMHMIALAAARKLAAAN